MKKIFLLSLSLLLLLCSCASSSPSYTPQNQKEVYTYKKREHISDSIKSEMSEYGFDYNIYVFEEDGKLDISVNLSRTMTGAEDVFVDTIEWSTAAVKKVKELNAFEMGELCITFILYKGSIDGDISATLKYTTTTLENGDLFCTYPNMVIKSKQNATIDEIRVYLTGKPAKASDELLKAVSRFEGEWQRGKYGKIIISEGVVNFVHEYEISGKEYVNVYRFYFEFDPAGKIIITNSSGQPRYDITLLDDVTLEIRSIISDDEPEVYTKISNSTVVPSQRNETE